MRLYGPEKVPKGGKNFDTFGLIARSLHRGRLRGHREKESEKHFWMLNLFIFHQSFMS
jgi:hypothetical protein